MASLRIVIIVIVVGLALPVSGDLDFALQCKKGFRVSSIRRVKNAYTTLGSLAVECEPISDAAATRCDALPKSPACTGVLEGCAGSSWLAGFRAYVVENQTAATILDPICCSSPAVTIDASTCINDHLNVVKQPFSHSIVSDLAYRGLQCWHQYNSDSKLVDLVWKAEICAYKSQLYPETNSNCPECKCDCGIRQCGDGKEPIRVIHKSILKLPGVSDCSCDCQCTYKCLT